MDLAMLSSFHMRAVAGSSCQPFAETHAINELHGYGMLFDIIVAGGL